MLIATDVGSGFTKSYSSVAGAVNSAFISSVGVANDEILSEYRRTPLPVIIYKGKHWLTGDDAALQLADYEKCDTLSNEWSGSDGWMVLLFRSIANFGIFTGQHKVVVGVPQAVFSERRQIIIDKIVGNHKLTVDGKPFDIDIVRGDHPIVMPQAAAVAWRVIEESPQLFGKKIGIIDIGTFTTGFAVMEGSTFVSRLSGGVEIGASTIADLLSKRIKQKYNETLYQSSLIKAVAEKKITIAGNEIQIADVVDDCVAEAAGRLLTQLKARWGESATEMNITIVGGAAHLFRKHIQKLFAHAEMPNPAISRFYPVLGMYAALRNGGEK